MKVQMQMNLGGPIKVEATLVGPYCVAQAWSAVERRQVDWAWDVNHTATGLRMVTYSDQGVAMRFAEDVYRLFGDVEALFLRTMDKDEREISEEDWKILDAIHARKRHPARLVSGALTVPRNP